ncbi:hypothetical protein Cgig2_014473 [Carnegiea gigantea]|uniref:Uncharacterized protein n=1 Tax=Carnegiea gigantea TaxID=171969 RepID=A0A9Q1KA03_9CARY|nr:hypothetical protein Cgig2_014473 [Carnegiea gigantea]
MEASGGGSKYLQYDAEVKCLSYRQHAEIKVSKSRDNPRTLFCKCSSCGRAAKREHLQMEPREQIGGNTRPENLPLTQTRPKNLPPTHGNFGHNGNNSPRISLIAGTNGSRFDILRTKLEEDNTHKDSMIASKSKEGEENMSGYALSNQEDFQPHNMQGNIDGSFARDDASDISNQNATSEGENVSTKGVTEIADNSSRRTPLTNRNARDFTRGRTISFNPTRANARQSGTHVTLKENLEATLHAAATHKPFLHAQSHVSQRTVLIAPPYSLNHTNGLLTVTSPLHASDPHANNDAMHGLT